MYNTEVFKDGAPKSWNVVFEAMDLPDGKPNKGRVQAFDGPIYIADAALYLMKHKPELGIKDPYELTEDQYKAALDLLRAQRQLVARYWHDAMVQIDDFKNEGIVASSSWPFQVNLLKAEPQPIAITIPGGRRDRLGRHHHDARRRRPPELRLYVARPFAQSEAPGRPRRVVRLGAGEPGGLQGQRPSRPTRAAPPTGSTTSTRSISGRRRWPNARRRTMPASRTIAGSPTTSLSSADAETPRRVGPRRTSAAARIAREAGARKCRKASRPATALLGCRAGNDRGRFLR